MYSHSAARTRTTLAGLTAALVLVTAVTVGGVVVVDRVLVGAVGRSLRQRCAESVADAFLTEFPIMRSDNESDAVGLMLVNETSAIVLATAVPPLRGAVFRVRTDRRTVAERGDSSGGYTVSRGTIGINRQTVRRSTSLSAKPNTALTGRMGRTQLDMNPAPNTAVQTIWVDGKVALHQPAGIEGQHVVGVSSRLDREVRVEATDDEPSRSADVSATASNAMVARTEVITNV